MLTVAEYCCQAGPDGSELFGALRQDQLNHAARGLPKSHYGQGTTVSMPNYGAHDACWFQRRLTTGERIALGSHGASSHDAITPTVSCER